MPILDPDQDLDPDPGTLDPDDDLDRQQITFIPVSSCCRSCAEEVRKELCCN